MKPDLAGLKESADNEFASQLRGGEPGRGIRKKAFVKFHGNGS
jgi:hypothetical protein